MLLDQRAFDIIVLNDDVLLEDFDGVQLIGSFALRKHHLASELAVRVVLFNALTDSTSVKESNRKLERSIFHSMKN